MIRCATRSVARLACLAAAAALLIGCSTTASYKPSAIHLPQVAPDARLPGKLLIYTTTEDENYTYKGSGKSLTSLGYTMVVPFGRIVKSMAGDVYGPLFDEGYDFANVTTSTRAYEVILRPRVERFEYRFNQAINAGAAITPQVNMCLAVALLDPSGAAIFERTYESGWVDGPSYAASFQPGEFVNDAINSALAQVMVRSTSDITSAYRRSVRSFSPGSPVPASDPDIRRSGTGFFITENGYLLSNFHVIGSARGVKVKIGKELLDAVVVKTDATNDIALLKVDGHHSALSFAPGHRVTLGAAVFTLGFPNPELQGVEPKLTDGVVSGLSGAQDDPTQLQISVPLQPGNSGGPLVDSAGNVIGIVKARLSDLNTLRATGTLPQNVNYAIKSAYAQALIESIPEVVDKLGAQKMVVDRSYEQVVSEIQKAVVLLLVY